MQQNRKVLARKTLSPARRPTRLSSSSGNSALQGGRRGHRQLPLVPELVEPLAEKVVLANRKKLRVITESTKKTDRLDARFNYGWPLLRLRMAAAAMAASEVFGRVADVAPCDLLCCAPMIGRHCSSGTTS